MRGFTVHSACPAEIDVLSTAVTREGRWVVLAEGGRTARPFSLRTRRLLPPILACRTWCLACGGLDHGHGPGPVGIRRGRAEVPADDGGGPAASPGMVQEYRSGGRDQSCGGRDERDLPAGHVAGGDHPDCATGDDGPAGPPGPGTRMVAAETAGGGAAAGLGLSARARRPGRTTRSCQAGRPG
jgi:hypothetical protein